MTTPIQAGWYDDPEDSNARRYWDGQNWTPHRERKQSPQSTPQPVAPAPPPPSSPPPTASQPPPSSAYLPPPSGQQPQWATPGPGTPRKSRTPLVVVGVIAAVVLFLIAGLLAYHFLFNTKTVIAGKAAEAVTSVVSQQTGFTPTDVSCPSGVEAQVDAKFQCHFTGPDGPYTAYMTVTKVDGDNVLFDIRTQLSSAPPPS
jgi:uncharacterized protein DUF4333/uncharacterized protein DUF2510